MPQDSIPIVGRELPKVLQPVPRPKRPDSLPIEADEKNKQVLAKKETQKAQALESNVKATQQIQILKGSNVDTIA